jgi:hypothetical protein
VLSDFEELNWYLYYSARSFVFDVLIWCLGPYVDDSRRYGVLRLYLAHVTRAMLRRWCIGEEERR